MKAKFNLSTIITLVATILFSISCNQEDSFTQNETSKKEINLEKLSDNIFKSNSFNKYFNASNSFYSKFNLDNDNISFVNEKEMISWVKNNINSTNFKNLNEFNKSLENINLLRIEMSIEFNQQFLYLNDNKYLLEDFNNELVKKANELKFFETHTFSISMKSSGDCSENFRDCVDRANENAAAQFIVSAVSAYFCPPCGAVTAFAAYVAHSNAIDACSQAFDDCMKNNYN